METRWFLDDDDFDENFDVEELDNLTWPQKKKLLKHDEGRKEYLRTRNQTGLSLDEYIKQTTEIKPVSDELLQLLDDGEDDNDEGAEEEKTEES